MEQDKCPPNQAKEEEIGDLPDEEFQVMIVKMIQNLENKMELQIHSLKTRIEKMQERFNTLPFPIPAVAQGPAGLQSARSRAGPAGQSSVFCPLDFQRTLGCLEEPRRL